MLTVVVLDGGEVLQDEHLVPQYTTPSPAQRTIVSYCDTYNLLILLMIPLIMLFKILSKSLSFKC